MAKKELVKTIKQKVPTKIYILKDAYHVKGELCKAGSKVDLTLKQANFLKSINKI